MPPARPQLRARRRFAGPYTTVERLERRALLASLGADGTLTVTGTDSVDVLYLDRTATEILVLSRSGTEEFPAAAVARLEVTTGAGDDSLTLRPGFAAHAGTPLPVAVDAGAGTKDVLKVFATEAGEKLHATPTSLAVGPRDGGGVAVSFSDVEDFTADAHAGDDSIFLADTSAAFTGYRLLGGDGDDMFTVGDGVTPNAWPAGAFSPATFLTGNGGADALTYNDQASVGTHVLHSYQIMARGLWRGQGSARFEHGAFERITLNTSDSPDAIGVIALHGESGELFINAGRSDAPGMPNPRTNKVEDSLHANWQFNASTATLTMSGADAGRYTFVGDYEPVNFSGIERLDGPDLTRPEVTGTTYRHAPRQEVEVRFSEDVRTSLQSGDLAIVNAATGAPVPAFATVTSPYGAPLVAAWRPGQPMAPGTYRGTIAASAIHDANDNRLAADYTFEFVVPASRVVGRHVFYNNSAFDRRDPAATAHDDAAIATDKVPLPTGGPAAPGIANVTSYAKGLNGLMVDVAGLPGMVNLASADFAFERSAGGDGSTWAAAAPPREIRVRRGAGVDGSDRVTLVWDDYQRGAAAGAASPKMAVADGWLRVTVLPGARTSLTEPHTFTFGNLVGETGGDASPLRVAGDDVSQVRRRLFSTAPIPSAFDFDRDGAVTAGDYVTARSRFGRTLPPPSPPDPPPMSPAESSAQRPQRATALLHPQRRGSILR